MRQTVWCALVAGVLLMGGCAPKGASKAVAPQAEAKPAAPAAAKNEIKVTIPLETVTFPNGKVMPLSVGIGSAAAHGPGEPANVVYFLTDRGPNIDCEDDTNLIGMDLCPKGKIFPTPQFTPAIYAMELDFEAGKAAVQAVTALKDSAGTAISGLPNPLASTELAFSSSGKPLPLDPNGLDSEGLVKMPDGTFWVAEEYAPSLVHLAADGRILERLVPQGVAKQLAGTTYPVREVFPAVVAKRKLNRGFESVAASPDGKALYVMLQSPLANPDNDAYKKSRNVRIFKLDAATKAILGEYVYVMDTPETFKKDNEKKARTQDDVRISEMVAYDHDKLIVLERISKTTKLYAINLQGASNIKGQWDSEKPSLELVSDLAKAGITPVTKKLVWNTDEASGYPSKIEGVALVAPGTLVVVNDNDFGIEGDATTIRLVQVTLP